MEPLKLYRISRFLFFAIAIIQTVLLSKYVSDGFDNNKFYGLIAMIALLLFVWGGTLYFNGLKYRLSTVWFCYTLVLVVMIGMIFGKIVINDNKLREQEIAACLCHKGNATINTTTSSAIKPLQSDSFFDSKFLKITLCFTPGEMLLLLTSVTDESEILKELYLTTVLDLFDGVEMIEVLHEDVCDKIPKGWEIAVLVAAGLFFLVSFLEVHQIKFEQDNVDETKNAQKTNSQKSKKEKTQYRKKTVVVNVIFQLVVNVAFLVIRLVLWLKYDFDSAVFLGKNIMSLLIMLVPVLEWMGWITTSTEQDKKSQQKPGKIGVENSGLST